MSDTTHKGITVAEAQTVVLAMRQGGCPNREILRVLFANCEDNSIHADVIGLLGFGLGQEFEKHWSSLCAEGDYIGTYDTKTRTYDLRYIG